MENILLVTGGCGFIGSNFIRYFLNKYPDCFILNLDKLTYAGNLENLKITDDNSNYVFVKGSICDQELMEFLLSRYSIDYIINFAAESHVDRSILDPGIFVETNIRGTQILLDVAKNYNVKKFVQISTDEVYGELGKTGYFTEQTPLAPNNPYSASKASADMLCRAYFRTYGLPVIITRCSNNYGPYQFPEKLIPLMIHKALNDGRLPVYGDGSNVRDWIYVLDHCKAIDTVLQKGEAGEVYNIGGNSEMQNIDVVRLIINKLGKSEDLIEFVKDRPGHDRRYAMDITKIQNELEWEPEYSFERGLEETIGWYLNNTEWTENCISGKYVKYYQSKEEHVDPEVEITRPRCYPSPVRFLLDFKLQSALQALNGRFNGARTLVVCCGSGMDAESLASQGMQVVGLDISFEALLRAKERARRYEVSYQLVLGDAENLPFKNDAFEITFVHDGLHHLLDAYQGVREMIRVASKNVVIAEPADALLTRLAVKLGISGNYEDAGNFVYRLHPRKLAQVFASCGTKRWSFKRHLIYYQPWTFRIYKLFELRPVFWLFKMSFYLVNWLLGRWGNSLKAVGWKKLNYPSEL